MNSPLPTVSATIAVTKRRCSPTRGNPRRVSTRSHLGPRGRLCSAHDVLDRGPVRRRRVVGRGRGLQVPGRRVRRPRSRGRRRRDRHAGRRQPRLQVPRAGPPRRRRDRAGRPRPAGRGGRRARAPAGGRRRLRRQRRDVDRLRVLRLGRWDDRAQRRARRLRDPGQHPHRSRGGGGDGARVDRGGRPAARAPAARGARRRRRRREATAAVGSRRRCSSYATGPATAGTTTSPSTCASTTTPTRSPSSPGWSTSTSST